MLLFKLFFAFIQIGLFSVGGGYAAIPLIQEQIVNIYRLMSLEEFSDLITIAEMTPGPISINSSTFVGIKLAGFFWSNYMYFRMYYSIIYNLPSPCTFLLQI